MTSIGRGETAITATAAELTGQVGLTVVAPDGVVLPGTVWVSPEIITEDDASTLDSLVYVGRGMRGFYDPFEGERRWRDDLELFLFEAHFGGGALIHVQAHPAYGEADSALAAARQFLPPMGRLPRMLIDGGREVELSPAPSYGAGGNACGKIYHSGARARPAGFVGRYNIRNLDTIRQMEHIVARMVGKRLQYRDLIADNGKPSAAA